MRSFGRNSIIQITSVQESLKRTNCTKFQLTLKCRIWTIQYFFSYQFSLWCMNINILWHRASQCHSIQWVCHKCVMDISEILISVALYMVWWSLRRLKCIEFPLAIISVNLTTLCLINTVPWCGKIRMHYSSSYAFLTVLSSIMPCSVYEFVLLFLLQGISDLLRKGM